MSIWREKQHDKKYNFTINSTSPCVLGIIVALAIFSSMTSKVPVLSSEALINMPELLEKTV